ncbi:hypothetical protein FGIG_10522 [Fasciola gigantica]|uniref:Uncharacterized protein n=1 Tax=Fasciola gigantica TaxID=46835 RepID=A0A504YVT3_FASGI|nr:hypothetical protein FGIG_10522 [Fasciola gigantica]
MHAPVTMSRGQKIPRPKANPDGLSRAKSSQPAYTAAELLLGVEYPLLDTFRDRAKNQFHKHHLLAHTDSELNQSMWAKNEPVLAWPHGPPTIWPNEAIDEKPVLGTPDALHRFQPQPERNHQQEHHPELQDHIFRQHHHQQQQRQLQHHQQQQQQQTQHQYNNQFDHLISQSVHHNLSYFDCGWDSRLMTSHNMSESNYSPPDAMTMSCPDHSLFLHESAFSATLERVLDSNHGEKLKNDDQPDWNTSGTGQAELINGSVGTGYRQWSISPTEMAVQMEMLGLPVHVRVCPSDLQMESSIETENSHSLISPELDPVTDELESLIKSKPPTICRIRKKVSTGIVKAYCLPEKYQFKAQMGDPTRQDLNPNLPGCRKTVGARRRAPRRRPQSNSIQSPVELSEVSTHVNTHVTRGTMANGSTANSHLDGLESKCQSYQFQARSCPNQNDSIALVDESSNSVTLFGTAPEVTTMCLNQEESSGTYARSVELGASPNSNGTEAWTFESSISGIGKFIGAILCLNASFQSILKWEDFK